MEPNGTFQRLVIGASIDLKNLHQSHPFESDIGDVESPQQPRVLVRTQLQIIAQACYAGIADICINSVSLSLFRFHSLSTQLGDFRDLVQRLMRLLDLSRKLKQYNSAMKETSFLSSCFKTALSSSGVYNSKLWVDSSDARRAPDSSPSCSSLPLAAGGSPRGYIGRNSKEFGS